MRSDASGDGKSLTPEDLGFAAAPDAERAVEWSKQVGGREIRFRRLETVSELRPLEDLQRAVFVGVSDVDLVPAEGLLTTVDTGGIVLGAFAADASGRQDEAVGFSIAWGGYVERRPRLISDYLGVRPEFRGGLGAELKRLQAALALAAGFPEIVWTVDPMRAANARLNFEKLGAYCNHYEEDRYGSGFAAGLYGGLPSDRLLVTWQIASAGVRDRLLGRDRPHSFEEIAGLPHFDAAAEENGPRVLVELPPDIDRLVRDDPQQARRWRESLRAVLPVAFERGYAITGFAGDRGEVERAVFLLERVDTGPTPL